MEFDAQEEDFHSIQEIYKSIDESHNTSTYTEDFDRLISFSETFQAKWRDTRNKIDICKSYLLNRVAIYNEWLNEVTLMNEWIDNLAKKIQQTRPSAAENIPVNDNVSIIFLVMDPHTGPL